jgi:D-alanine-D-alanine ligase
VFIVTDAHDHPPQVLFREDWTFGEAVLCETYIPGKELTCAVVKGEATGVIEIVPKVKFYDYEAKYAPGGSEHVLPAVIPDEITRSVQRLTLMAHNALGCRGVTRADFRYDDTRGVEGIVCLEVNTIPGMTTTSLVPELAAYAGMSFEQLVSWMIEDASLNR